MRSGLILSFMFGLLSFSIGVPGESHSRGGGGQANSDLHITLTPETTSSQSFSPHLTIGGSSVTHLDSNDKQLARIPIRQRENQSFYDVDLQLGKQKLRLAVDISQPDLWVMNKNSFYECEQKIGIMNPTDGRLLNSSMEDKPPENSRLNKCAYGGVYTPKHMSTQSLEVVIPELYHKQARGNIYTDNVTLFLEDEQELALPDFSFVVVNETNQNIGGLGLAGGSQGSNFLDALRSNYLIKSPGYSLWIQDIAENGEIYGDLILGAVDKKYVKGNFYVFDMLNTVADNATSGDKESYRRLSLLALQVSGISLKNHQTLQKVSLMPGQSTIAFALDSLTPFNYLPQDIIMNLALQTNAFFNDDFNRWIVECSIADNVDASIYFKFGDLDVDVPIKDMISQMHVQNLSLSDGSKACALNVLSSTESGANILGNSFLKNVYLAVDNAGKKIALGNSRKNLVNHDTNSSTEKETKRNASYSTSMQSAYAHSSHETIHTSIGYIESNFIPFATPHTSNTTGAFTFTVLDEFNTESPRVPSFFGGTFVSDVLYVSSFSAAENLPLMSSTTSTGKAVLNRSPALPHHCSASSLVFAWTALVFLISLLLL